MKKDLTVEEMIQGLKDFAFKMQNESNELMFETVKELEVEYKERIFVFGENTKGTKSSYGNYRDEKTGELWPVLRERKGRQTEYVDLFYTGELESSIKPVKGTKVTASMAIPSDKNYKKARFQERLQSGDNGLKSSKYTNPDSKDIFGISNKEIQSAEKKMLDKLDTFLKNTIFG